MKSMSGFLLIGNILVNNLLSSANRWTITISSNSNNRWTRVSAPYCFLFLLSFYVTTIHMTLQLYSSWLYKLTPTHHHTISKTLPQRGMSIPVQPVYNKRCIIQSYISTNSIIFPIVGFSFVYFYPTRRVTQK